MPKVEARTITMNYEQQGTGEPLLLIPYLAADHACYAFQVGEYAKYFSCISVDLRGTGDSGKPEGAYSTEVLADDVVAFMQAAKIERRTSPVFLWARLWARGSPPSIRNEFCLCRYIRRGRRATPSSGPSSKVGR
jgi:pimeloyl-ACP methyl ester carboxylesterase